MTQAIASSLKLKRDARIFIPKTFVLIKGASKTHAPTDTQENVNLVKNVHIKQNVPIIM